MPRKPFSIQQVYIADGFADDCDELIHRCSRVDVLNYRIFCIYYKDMNFASAYQGRTSNAEVAELSEELLQIAKYYMVLDTSNFEESVAGLFLVYALLNLQPYPRFAVLRIVPDDIPAIERIERVARRDRRLDVLYVLGSVLIQGPVQYHAVNRPRGMETAIKKNLDGFCNIDVTGIRPKGVYFRQNEELDIIREMSGIFKRYTQAKSQIPGLKSRSLSHSNDKLAEELGTSLKKVINGIVEERKDTERETMVQEIKKRAMKHSVGVVRHLYSASQRSPEKKIQPEQKPTTSTTPKNNTKLSPKRRPPKPRKESKKNKKKNYSSSSSEDTEEELDDWCIETRGSLKPIEEPEPNEILQVIEVPKETKSESLRVIEEPVETGNRVLEDHEIQFKIDSLPSLITAEINGRLVQIEIIDEMKKGNEKEEDEMEKSEVTEKTDGKEKQINKGDVTTKGTETPEKTKVAMANGGVEKVTKQYELNKGDETIEIDEENKKDGPRKRGRPKKEEAKLTDDEIFKKPFLRSSPRLQKVSKRDMKKPVLKSKFKKMGILSVANFEDEISKHENE